MDPTGQRIATLLERARRDNDTELIELLESNEMANRLRLPTERELELRERAEMHIDPLSGYYIHPDDMVSVHGRSWSRTNLLRFVITHGQNKVPVWPDTGVPMSADDLTRIGVSTNSTGQVVMTAVRPGAGYGIGAAGLIGGLALGSALASRPYYYYGYPYGPYSSPYTPYGYGGGYGGGYGYGYDPFDYDDHRHRRDGSRRRTSSEERGRNRRTSNREHHSRSGRDGRSDMISMGRNKLNHGEDRGERNESRNSPSDATRRRTGNRGYSARSRDDDIGPIFDTYVDDFGERLSSAGHATTTRRTNNDPLV